MSAPPPGNLPPQSPQPYQPGYPQPFYGQPDAQYAMPAMVLGIISLCLLPLGCCCGVGELVVIALGIAALALGFVARGKITASQGTLGGSGKALAGIITGGTAVGIAIPLGAAILLFGITTQTITNTFPTPT